MLHNLLSYVNECYQIHKKLCFIVEKKGIFGGGVYIKFTEYLCKKLSFYGFLPERLDFF